MMTQVENVSQQQFVVLFIHEICTHICTLEMNRLPTLQTAGNQIFLKQFLNEFHLGPLCALLHISKHTVTQSVYVNEMLRSVFQHRCTHIQDILRKFAHIFVKENSEDNSTEWARKEKKNMCVCHTLTCHVVRLERVTDVQRGHAQQHV